MEIGSLHYGANPSDVTFLGFLQKKPSQRTDEKNYSYVYLIVTLDASFFTARYLDNRRKGTDDYFNNLANLYSQFLVYTTIQITNNKGLPPILHACSSQLSLCSILCFRQINGVSIIYIILCGVCSNSHHSTFAPDS